MNELAQSFDPNWPPVLAGLILLAWGRRLYHVLLGVVGFGLGWTAAGTYLPIPPDLQLPVAIACGLACAFLAFFVQRVALGIAGFALGVFSTVWLASNYGVELSGWTWLLVLVGGLIASSVFQMLFQTALVVASSLVGALLVVSASGFESAPGLILLVVLTILGVGWQSRAESRPGRRRRSKRRSRGRSRGHSAFRHEAS